MKLFFSVYTNRMTNLKLCFNESGVLLLMESRLDKSNCSGFLGLDPGLLGSGWDKYQHNQLFSLLFKSKKKVSQI